MPSRQGGWNGAAVSNTRNAGVSSEVVAVSNRNEEAADVESTNAQASGQRVYVPPLSPGAKQGVGAISIRVGGVIVLEGARRMVRMVQYQLQGHLLQLIQSTIEFVFSLNCSMGILYQDNNYMDRVLEHYGRL